MMKVTFKHALIAVIVFCVTLGFLKGVQAIYMRSVVRTPLIRAIENVPGIKAASMVGNDAVRLVLRPQANLMSSYQAVVSDAESSLGQAPLTVTIAEHSNSIMTSVANQVQFIVAQGIATGQYVTMEHSIVGLASKSGLNAVVQINSTHVYVTLTSDHGKFYWYHVVPIASNSEKGAAS
jgi:hypothetical protein